MGDGDHHQTVDAREIVRIACVEGESVRERDRSDHRVVRPRIGLAARTPKRCGDLPERSGCLDIEWEGVEVGLGLLEVRKTSGSLGLTCDQERPDR
jgi:hypothetical protein